MVETGIEQLAKSSNDPGIFGPRSSSVFSGHTFRSPIVSGTVMDRETEIQALIWIKSAIIGIKAEIQCLICQRKLTS
ncbi:hypothetical protein J2X61_005310 [Bacillus sp. 3255]|nr:hypothetical protein [Bacillus sp. 3255]